MLNNINNPRLVIAKGKQNSRPTIDWTTISKNLNRKHQACMVSYVVVTMNYQLYHVVSYTYTWKQICSQSLRKGPFTEEEDEHIILRLSELIGKSTLIGTKFPRGTWAIISAELNRDLKCVYEHWTVTLSKSNSHP